MNEISWLKIEVKLFKMCGRADYNLNLGLVLFVLIWCEAVNARVRKKLSRILTKIFKV